MTKKYDFAFTWLLNLVLAFLIYLNAEAGRLLGIKSLALNFSAVWPATGFSLAALLIFGFKMWPGILLGNLSYNFLHLYGAGQDLLHTSLAATCISLGSLAQALVGGFVMRKYATSGYLTTMKDVVLFLLFGGSITCFIASSIGVSTLYAIGELSAENIPLTWLTFWLGDTMGIFIFTPLIVVWALQKPDTRLWFFSWENLCMLLLFAAIGYFTLQGYPLGYLFIPYSIWVAYRFSFHGVTLAILFITFFIIVPIATGAGPFIVNFTAEMLLIIVSFLEIIASTALLFAAVTSERNAAWQLIKKHRLDLIS